MLTEKYLRKQIRKQLLKLVAESRSNLLIELEQPASGEAEEEGAPVDDASGDQEGGGEKEAATGAPGSASKSEVVSKLKDLIANIADIESSQYGALLAVVDEILELAASGELKKRATTITKGLNKFDK